MTERVKGGAAAVIASDLSADLSQARHHASVFFFRPEDLSLCDAVQPAFLIVAGHHG